MFAQIKYWLADHLFTDELDDAFNMGIREGQRRLQFTLNARMTELESQDVKNRQPGITAVKEAMPEVFA